MSHNLLHGEKARHTKVCPWFLFNVNVILINVTFLSLGSKLFICNLSLFISWNILFGNCLASGIRGKLTIQNVFLLWIINYIYIFFGILSTSHYWSNQTKNIHCLQNNVKNRKTRWATSQTVETWLTPKGKKHVGDIRHHGNSDGSLARSIFTLFDQIAVKISNVTAAATPTSNEIYSSP